MIARVGQRSPLVSPRTTRYVRRGALYAVLVIGGLAMCFPFFWMILTSFKTYGEAIATPPTVFPGDWGARVVVLWRLVRDVPLLVIIFAAWMVLGGWLARRIPDAVVGGIYIVAHLALFFLLGSLRVWGSARFGVLWDGAMARSGLDLPKMFDNYVEAWGRAPFAVYFKNSVIMSTLTPALIVATSAPAAYAFARLQFPARNLLFVLFLATMMVPSEVTLIPNFITISELGWKNTYAALIIPWVASVMSIFFLRQFFLSIPNELFDAAVIDGCGHLRFLWSVAVPLSRPAIVSTSMFNFLSAWNSLLWPLLVTDAETMRPLALGLASFSNEAGMQPQLYMAAATFTITPVVVLFLFVQRQFIEGIARSGIK